MSQTHLGTSRWINKAHSSTWIYSYSMRGTETAAAEDWWPSSNWLKHSVPKTQTTAPRLMHAFLIYPLPDAGANVVMSLNDVTFICSPSFSGKKHCACAGESLWFTCTSTSIPANYFLPLCMDQFFSIPQILRLWYIVYTGTSDDACRAQLTQEHDGIEF